MAISFVSSNVVTTGINVALTPVPGTYAIGDALIYITGEHQGTDNISTPAGWNLLSANSVITTTQIYGRIAQSTSETIPSVNWGATNRGWALVSAFRGVDTSFTSLMSGSAERTANTTANIVGTSSARTPTSNGALCILAGCRNKLVDSNASVFSFPSGWDGMIAQLVQPGSVNSMSAAASYWIQPTATLVVANTSMIGSVPDGVTQAMAGTMIFLAPAASGGGGGGGTGTPLFPPPKRKTYIFYDNYYPR